MLWRNKNTIEKDEEKEEISKINLKPVPRNINNRVVDINTYENLTTKLEFFPIIILREKILQLLTANGIKVYDSEEVDNYLTEKASNLDKYWIWRPLREKDIANGWGMQGHGTCNKSQILKFGHGSCWSPKISFDYRPYQKPIPIKFLKLIDLIESTIEDPRLLFWVTEYAVPNPDPFIAAKALDFDAIIFGMWDEPDF